MWRQFRLNLAPSSGRAKHEYLLKSFAMYINYVYDLWFINKSCTLKLTKNCFDNLKYTYNFLTFRLKRNSKTKNILQNSLFAFPIKTSEIMILAKKFCFCISLQMGCILIALAGIFLAGMNIDYMLLCLNSKYIFTLALVLFFALNLMFW